MSGSQLSVSLSKVFRVYTLPAPIKVSRDDCDYVDPENFAWKMEVGEDVARKRFIKV